MKLQFKELVSHNLRFSKTNNNKNWNDAKAKCEELGGKLVEPRSEEENDEMIEEANKAWSSYAYWIGIHYSKGEYR